LKKRPAKPGVVIPERNYTSKFPFSTVRTCPNAQKMRYCSLIGQEKIHAGKTGKAAPYPAPPVRYNSGNPFQSF
jgi:hypothetical protein